MWKQDRDWELAGRGFRALDDAVTAAADPVETLHVVPFAT
jgi:hypothetical protein